MDTKIIETIVANNLVELFKPLMSEQDLIQVTRIRDREIAWTIEDRRSIPTVYLLEPNKEKDGYWTLTKRHPKPYVEHKETSTVDRVVFEAFEALWPEPESGQD